VDEWALTGKEWYFSIQSQEKKMTKKGMTRRMNDIDQQKRMFEKKIFEEISMFWQSNNLERVRDAR